jgi:hypothetical protein
MQYDGSFANAVNIGDCAAMLGSAPSSTSLSRRKAMSERNGDKSRFHRVRKQNIQRRKRTFELLQAAAIKSGDALGRKRMSSAPVKDAHE